MGYLFGDQPRRLSIIARSVHGVKYEPNLDRIRIVSNHGFKDFFGTHNMALPLMKAVIIELPMVIKSHSTQDGRRIVELEASVEKCDLEGDVILQSALMKSRDSFLKSGHLDIEHYSEIGDRLDPPIKNPSSYIVGRPLDLLDLGNGRTGVVGEISKSNDGSFRPDLNQWDMLWESLNRTPPVKWLASVYGYPIPEEVIDCSSSTCTHGATRYLVKGLDLRSLAFCKNPMNNHIVGAARVVSQKSFVTALSKATPFWPDGSDIFGPDSAEPMLASMVGGLPGSVGGSAIQANDSLTQNDGTVHESANPVAPNCPASIDEMWGEYQRHILRDCPAYDMSVGNTLGFFRDHYMQCRGLPFDKADILAHALMYVVKREQARKRR